MHCLCKFCQHYLSNTAFSSAKTIIILDISSFTENVAAAVKSLPKMGNLCTSNANR